MSKHTTPEQYEKLMSLMATQRDIASGYYTKPKEEVAAFWEEAALVLNSLGPPTKNGMLWKKVWIDWKAYIKRKLTSNKKEKQATGGGSCRLQPISPLEERVIAITGLEKSTSGITGTQDFGVNTLLGDVGGALAMDISTYTDAGSSEPSTSNRRQQPSTYTDAASSTPSTSNRRQQPSNKDTTVELIKELIASQEATRKENREFQENVMSSLRRLNMNMESLAETAKAQLMENKRHNKIKEEFLQEKTNNNGNSTFELFE